MNIVLNLYGTRLCKILVANCCIKVLVTRLNFYNYILTSILVNSISEALVVYFPLNKAIDLYFIDNNYFQDC